MDRRHLLHAPGARLHLKAFDADAPRSLPRPPSRRASFRFITAPAAPMAALRSGDGVAFPRVAVWLYQPPWITMAQARLKGLWTGMPLFVNELSALHWT